MICEANQCAGTITKLGTEQICDYVVFNNPLSMVKFCWYFIKFSSLVLIGLYVIYLHPVYPKKCNFPF